MARRRGGDDEGVSLFPFLSILACVIGTLTLMITALALGQMDNDTVASAETFERVKREAKKSEKEIVRLRSELEQAEEGTDDSQKELARLREQLARIQRDVQAAIDANKEPPPEVEMPRLDTAAHEKRMKALESELTQVAAQIKELLALLAKRKKPPPEAEVRIQPSGSGVDLVPTFVECTGRDIVMYDREPPRRVPRTEIATDKEFLALLDRIAKAPKATVIFLVRDSGLGTYYAARGQAQARYARNGKLPVIGKGKLDLSLFEEVK